MCDYLRACGGIFGFWLSHLARLLSKHTPQLAKCPLSRNDRSCGLNFKKATTSEKVLGKFNPIRLRTAQSGGNARPREAGPLSGVGGVCGRRPG